ncbi:hypothetical protein [Butyricimonas paravirosa]|uniref:hypothetical protein n=1 Tax=Butyricimonas paravirosa TaxID=1472417 RepID=UPI0022E1EAB4|nr:hypothetical protein [Butyricimonas paravirosa]
MKYITFFYLFLLFCCFSCKEKSKSYYNQPTKIIEQTVWSIKQYENGNVLPQNLISHYEDEYSFIGYYNAKNELVKEYKFLGYYCDYKKPDIFHLIERNSKGLIEREETKIAGRLDTTLTIITYKRDSKAQIGEQETKENGKVIKKIVDKAVDEFTSTRTIFHETQKQIEEWKFDENKNVIEIHSKTYNEFGLAVEDIWQKFLYKEGKEIAYICAGNSDYRMVDANTGKITSKGTGSMLFMILTHYDEHGNIIKEIELKNPTVQECSYLQNNYLSELHIKAYNDIDMNIISEGEAYAKQHLEQNHNHFSFDIISYTYKYNTNGEWIEKIKYINDIPIYMVKRKIEYINN